MVNYELDYEYVPTTLVGQPEEKPRTERGTVRIGITFTVISVWQLRNDEDILKVLYQHAKREVERRAMEGNLDADPQIELDTSTAPEKCPYDPARVIREFGKPFKVEVQGVKKGARGGAIFICHAEVDKPIATVLKHYFEKADQPVEVFQASHPSSLPGGREWWLEIRDALRRASVVLTLYSERSKERPWLHFESGGAFFKSTLVIPLVVPPEHKSIPPPLGLLQARDLAAKDDVSALVGQVGKTLGRTFVDPSDSLWTAVQDAVKKVAASTADAAKRTSSIIFPWERQLRAVAAEGGTVRIHPVVPPAFADDVFEIGSIDEMAVGLIKQDSRQRIDVPPYRVVGLRKAGDKHFLDIRGRVQWTDDAEAWTYFPEELLPNDPYGLPREVDIQAPEARHLQQRLNAAGWQAEFANERTARALQSKAHLFVYAADGRYLRVLNRVIPLVLVKRRS